MVEKTVKVINRAGLHARPASMIVEIAKDFSSSIHFYLDSSEINAKSVLGIITLGAAYGSEIKMTAEGPDEKAALDALEKVFNSKFEEE